MSESHYSHIHFFREAAPYIQAHKGKTFVVAISSPLLAAKQLKNLLNDIAILSTLGVKLVLVYGADLQIEQQLKQKNINFKKYKSRIITTGDILEVNKNVVGRLRINLETCLSYALNQPSVINQGLAVISGSFITAKPIGIHDGVDYQHTGSVRKIADQQIKQQLAQHSLVLLSPLGLSPTGESYHLSYKEIAVHTAKILNADKLIFLQSLSTDAAKKLPRQLTLNEAKQYSSLYYLIKHIDAAVQAGVERVHLINAQQNGSLLLELYTRDGSGTLISHHHYERLTTANIEDIAGILDLIRPLEKKGILIRRSREQLEREIDNFIVIKRDKKVIACVALYRMKTAKIGELACFVVDNQYRGRKKGDVLLNFAEKSAKQMGLEQLLVLTTQTTDWFRERGFVLGTVDDLPEAKKRLYNYQRNSHILLKDIHSESIH